MSNRLLARAESSRMREMAFRAAAMKASSQQAQGGDAFFTSGQKNLGQQSNSGARDQYAHLRGQVFTSIRPICTRIAGQQIRVGRIKKNGSFSPGKRRHVEPMNYKVPDYMIRALGGDANRIDVFDQHEILDKLHRPNRISVDWSLKFVTVASMEMTGWAYWWYPEGPDGKEIWHVPTHWVTPLHEGRAFSGWSFKPDGVMVPKILEADEISPFFYPTPESPLMALSPAECGGKEIMANESIVDAHYLMFRNGISPRHAVITGDKVLRSGTTIKQRLTKSQRMEVRTALMARYGDISNYGVPAILDGMIQDIKKISNSPEEMDFLESSKTSEGRVSRIFGVNPTVTGANDGVNYAQAAAADGIFCDVVINPKLELLGRVMTIYVVPQFSDDESLVLFFEPAVPSDPSAKTAMIERAFQTGGATRAEYRRHLGYEIGPEDECYMVNPMMQWQPASHVKGAKAPEPPAPPPGQEEAGGSMFGKPTEKPADDTEQEPAAMAAAYTPLSVKRLPDEQVVHFYKAYFGLWERSHTSRQNTIAGAARKFFRDQADAVLAALRRSPATQDGRRLAERLLDQKTWGKKLRSAIGPAVAHTAALGAAIELHAFGGGRAAKPPQNAPQALERVGKAAGELAIKADDFQYPDLSVDLPEDVLEGIGEFSAELMSQDYWDGINETTLEKLSKAIEDGLTAGQTLREIAGEIEDGMFGGSQISNRAELIARTETTGAMNAGQQSARESLAEDGTIEQKEWFATLDMKTRDDHADADGQRVDVDQPFIIGGEEAMYPGDANLSAEQRCNCILPGVEVTCSVEAATRSRYDGQAVEIVTASGRRMPLTVNHPVLTEDGFVAAGLLKCGQQVLSGCGELDVSVDGCSSEHVDHVPSKIEQVFAAVSLFGSREIVKVSEDDFHGDGHAIDGNIEIVRPDWELLERMEAGGGDECRDLILSLADAGLSYEASGSSLGDAIGRIGLTTAGTPCGTALPLGGGGVSLDRKPFESLCFGLAAHWYASLLEFGVEVSSVDAKLFSNLLQRNAGLVKRDRIVEVRRFRYVGHVYDLQAGLGWILANGCVISNCRCVASSVTSFSDSTAFREVIRKHAPVCSVHSEISLMLSKAFCPTGPGGGVDNSCGGGGKSRSSDAVREISDKAGQIRFTETDESQGGTLPDGVWGMDRSGHAFHFTTPGQRRFTVNVADSDEFMSVAGSRPQVVSFKDESGEYNATGKGEAFSVFSHVVPAIVAFIKEKDPPVLVMTAKGESRQRLYDRLVKTMLATGLGRFALSAEGDPKKYVIAKNDIRYDVEERLGDHGFKSVHAGWDEIFASEFDPAWMKESSWS